MKREENKSDCPINFTVEIFGDTWSLLIIRDMIALGKKTFSEFLELEERIGPSVLTDRLAHLEAKGVITKKQSETDKRKFIYSITEKGLDLIPIVYEMALWGSKHSPNPVAPDAWFKAMKHDKEQVLRLYREAVASGSSFMNGPNSVVKKLNL
ncbi:HxlR family transcriptional regulator [Brevibacillus panacihumi W25]|uniref:HxlR family transcriptional regulator n=1 Tax=Brevibacillus panacihumi W25 TaxID=1408254 RepID=V6M3Z5_9BACL|nr:helix-turn-helix domain-containing protein [Brevibacillus panacihumi]EST52585.1 HxlR family transcriptional regulator [Brevibacillus panacihumi W25]